MTQTSKPITILVIDDDLVDRRQVRRLLEASEWQVHIEEAEDIPSSRGKIDMATIILVDYQLPGEDGLAFLHGLPPAHSRPPVVIMTGNGDESLAVAAMKAGAADYLIKGELSTERLTTTLGNAIDLHQEGSRRAQAEQALARSHRQTRCILACTQTLLLDLKPDKTLSRVMRNLARGMGVDRVSLFRNEQETGEGFHCITSATATTSNDNMAALPEHDRWLPIWSRWQHYLSRGDSLTCPHPSADSEEITALHKQACQSTAIVPFYLNGRWSGFIRADSFTNSTPLPFEDIRFLQSAGDIISAWLERREQPHPAHPAS